MTPDGRRTALAHIGLAALAVGGLACSTIFSTMATPQPTSPPQAEASSPAPPPTTTQVLPTELPTRPQVLEGQLSPDGPWLVFPTNEGLWAVNPNGSGLTQLTGQPIHGFQTMHDGIAPSGGHVAFITSASLLEFYNGLTLNLVSMPSGETRVVTPLTSAATEPGPQAEQGDPRLEGVRAIVETPSMTWSPDGRRLAFMGLMEGPSSDLYVYSLEDGQISRLTSGPSHAIRPNWSPDGEYVLHFGVPGLGTGAGASIMGAWVARADGSAVESLYDPVGSGDELVVGWLNAETFVVHSWNSDCGYTNLRTFNIETGAEHILVEECFSYAALDANSGRQLVAPLARDGPGSWLLLIEPGAEPAWLVVEDEPRGIRWSSEANLFLVQTDVGVLAVSPSGDFTDLAVPPGAEGFPAVSPEGTGLAWTGSGLWVGSLANSLDQPPRRVFAEPVSLATWAPEGDYLLFFSGGRFYVGTSPIFNPVLIAEGMSDPREPGWVWR